MNFKDVLQGRRSVRSYKNKPIPREVAESLLTAAEFAPSAGNLLKNEA